VRGLASGREPGALTRHVGARSSGRANSHRFALDVPERENLLWALDQAPEGRLRMNELAAFLNVSRGGLTKLVDRLEGAGLIRREACPADRRGYHAVLLPTGADMLGRMWPVYEAELERHVAVSITDEEAQTIAAALTRAAESACTLEDTTMEPAEWSAGVRADPVGVQSQSE